MTGILDALEFLTFLFGVPWAVRKVTGALARRGHEPERRARQP